MEITQHDVKSAIQNFLIEEMQNKLEPEQKKLDKAQQNNKQDEIAQTKKKIDTIKKKYSLEEWILKDACRMAEHIRFGTHISKGVHPDSKGNNVNFRSSAQLPLWLVGSQTQEQLELDANGNAAVLPVARFFNITIHEVQNIKLQDLIQENHPSLTGAFSTNSIESDRCQKIFREALENKVKNPVTHELNKQILWPLSDNAQHENRYQCLVPLYPSGLTHAVFRKINQLRFSDENKQARENRSKKNVTQQPYLSINDLAVTKIGGANPQNAGRLSAAQMGRNFLLPSLPPNFKQRQFFTLHKNQQTIFNKALRYRCRHSLDEIFNVVKSDKNIVDVRALRKQELDLMLAEILSVAKEIQTNLPVGWSRDYQLDMTEKYWLDPSRAKLKGEEDFATQREKSEWLQAIQNKFALWLNAILQKQFPKHRYDFGDQEHIEWFREMREAIKASQRAGDSVFEGVFVL